MKQFSEMNKLEKETLEAKIDDWCNSKVDVESKTIQKPAQTNNNAPPVDDKSK